MKGLSSRKLITGLAVAGLGAVAAVAIASQPGAQAPAARAAAEPQVQIEVAAGYPEASGEYAEPAYEENEDSDEYERADESESEEGSYVNESSSGYEGEQDDD